MSREAATRGPHPMILSKAKQVLARRADSVLVEKYIKGPPDSLEQDPEKIEAQIRWYHELSERYEDPALFQTPDVFFPTPSVPSPTIQRGRKGALELWWPSNYTPLNEDVADDYLETPHNHTVRARLLTTPHGNNLAAARPPAIIFIHGYRGGALDMEQLLWPLSAWLEAGYDVGMIVLPHHGERKNPEESRPPYPGFDPRITIEGLRQAVWDTRALLAWLLDRGAPHVGVCGMSLGGLVNALMMGAEENLSFAVPTVPLSSFVSWGEDHGTLLGRGEQQRRYKEALQRITRVIDPLSRKSLVPADRVGVVAGKNDRINRVHHARSIAAHSGGELVLIPGGHLLQFGLGDAFGDLARRFHDPK